MSNHPDLIVLVPGIAGSTLKKNGQMIWGASAKTAWNVTRNDSLDLLTISGVDDGSDDLDDGVEATSILPNIMVVPGLWKIFGYSIISQHLVSSLSLQRRENYFEFAYDWRRDNRVSAKKLARFCREKLSSWREKSGNDSARVTLIAHSMGGLLSRYYIECLEGWRETRMLISLGTPYRGSLNALDGICNGLKKSVGGVTFADGTRAFRSFSSLYQLLPTYPVVNDGDFTLKRVCESALPNMDIARARDAKKFHDEISEARLNNLNDPQYATNQPKIVPVIGIDQPTYQSARITLSGRVEMLRAYEGENLGGDGTVPRVSAIHEDSALSTAVYLADTHAALPNAGGAMTHLKGVVQGSAIDMSRFRASDDAANLSLDVDDMHDASMPVVVSAQSGSYRQNLVATFSRQGDQGEAEQALMYPCDGIYQCSVMLPAGLYGVSVSGDGLNTVSDVIGVVGAQEQSLP